MSENTGSSTANGTRSFSQSSSRPSRGASSVETSVTKLLVSTKQLLQRLTQWSKGQANEKNVSDAYVQLGNDFKLVTKQFSYAGLEVSDLGDLPTNLRKVLEVALRERPSEETLDKFLPSIREIVVTLLDKLKVKQTLLKSAKHNAKSSQVPLRSSRSAASSNAPSGRSTPSHKSSDSLGENANGSPTRLPAATSTPTKENRPSLRVVKQREDQDAALAQLKKSDTLQRRASKRFSAYHMAKLSHQSTSEAAASATPPHYVGDHSSNQDFSNYSAPSKYVAQELAAMPSHDSSIMVEGNEECVTVFLTLDGKAKKCSLSLPTSFNALRLLFVEKFTYTPGTSSFPEICIRDPGYDIFYELESGHLDKIREGSVLSLQVGTKLLNDEDSLVKVFEQFEQRFEKKQEILHAEIQKLRESTSSRQDQPIQSQDTLVNNSLHAELESLRHQFSILRQIHDAKKKTYEDNISGILEKVAKFKSLSFNSSTTANRVYMEKSHSKLSEVSDGLLGKVDDLQDVIEALRKDVAVRGSKPSKKKLGSVRIELKNAQACLHKMQEHISVEKPNWKKIWESELEKVCEEQQFLTLQEDLAFDFKQDLDKVQETFDLVTLCCEEKEKNPKKTNSLILPIAKPGTFNQLRSAVLDEVAALQPDHQERIDAIEKAEKLRTKEMTYRDNSEFEDELGNYIDKKSFKKAGGISEIEKQRQRRDEENLRANFRPMPT
ncbi:LAME_0H04654g1_1 [Lachancea meyersii CBS 8951]|uniref:LAME_0H04654g1_1 n=1 Tax=Lachancea meyersii CBS 8951 TaxID=1266667 RepID=A0A1G4KE37_9SACH|nr:LAME_0H04654g1_1 [Lachancea meyersii CBS 8951]